MNLTGVSEVGCAACSGSPYRISEYESPAWHATELAETERWVAEGKEQVMEWEAAKKKLRGRFE